MIERVGVKRKGMFVFLAIAVFVLSIIVGVVFKLSYTSPELRKYKVEWNEEVGTEVIDLSYGPKEANKFDLYLPADKTKESYGLVVYLHAGGFTTGDKAGDKDILHWLVSKGYVACGINYTLRDDAHPEASVYSQSTEIKESMPIVVEEAEKLGYNIDGMAIAGGSAGGTLAMLYAYRDTSTSPVPVKFMFEAVGPSSFYKEDWTNYGLDQNSEAAAELFGIMAGKDITVDMIESNNYQEAVKDISGYSWVNESSVPSVIAYGAYDKVCPFKSAKHLVDALTENTIDYKYFELPHSGHALQNDDKLYAAYMEAVEEYLTKYMPVSKA